ncbi:hypothetical protein [Promicromonospora sp. NPDC023805]|uniref:hypothetical protein n=1 Tax=Promicromonospora sp. NPDC023805 TaxID=3154696 RepID=UPI0033C066D0
MSGTTSKEPQPPKDPPKNPPKSARGPRSTRRRRPANPTVKAAVITGLASIVSVAVGAFGTWVAVAANQVPVPTDDGLVTINVIQEQSQGLQSEVDDLTAENERLREEPPTPTPSPSPTTSPPPTEPTAVPSKLIYQDRKFTIVGSEQFGRTSVVDFDSKGYFALQDSEWDDIQDADGPDPDSADMAIEEDDYLVFARTIGHSSHDAAPASDDPAACLADARASEYDELYVPNELQVDDVICTQTTAGAVARLVVTDVNSEDYPYSVELSVTLWE